MDDIATANRDYHTQIPEEHMAALPHPFAPRLCLNGEASRLAHDFASKTSLLLKQSSASPPDVRCYRPPASTLGTDRPSGCVRNTLAALSRITYGSVCSPGPPSPTPLTPTDCLIHHRAETALKGARRGGHRFIVSEPRSGKTLSLRGEATFILSGEFPQCCSPSALPR